MLLLIVFGILVIIYCYYLLITPFNYWKNKKVPHPPVSYLFGNIGPAVFLKKPLGQIYCDIYQQYTSLRYVGAYKVRTPCIIVRDLGLVKEILVKKFDSFSNRDISADDKNDPLFAKHIFVAKGRIWKDTRTHVQRLYTSKQVKDMYPLIDAISNNMIKYINTDIIGIPAGVQAKDFGGKYSIDVAASCALGLDGNSFVNPNSEYMRMWKKILSPSLSSNIKFMLLFLFPSLGSLIRCKIVPNESDAYYRKIINNTLEYRKKKNIRRGDFLDALIELKENIGEDKFTNEDITAHALGFFTDATEVSANVLSFVLYELGVNPDIQEKLKKEINETLQNNKGKFNYDAIQQMTFLDQIVNESMRKNSGGFFLSRVCTKQFCLGPYAEGAPSIIIEPGTSIIVPTRAIQLDPNYFSNPSIYDPSRFSSENRAKLNGYSFMPFGEGPRNCLGRRFGILQVKIAIANIVNNFEVRINKNTEVPYQLDPRCLLLTVRNGIWLDFHKRP